MAPQAAEKRKGGFPATLLTCSICAELDGTPPAPSVRTDSGRLGSLGEIPVSQHVVPDLLHQLECPGQRGTEHIHCQEIPVPGRHRGLHKYLLDVSHGGTHVLQKK